MGNLNKIKSTIDSISLHNKKLRENIYGKQALHRIDEAPQNSTMNQSEGIAEKFEQSSAKSRDNYIGRKRTQVACRIAVGALRHESSA